MSRYDSKNTPSFGIGNKCTTDKLSLENQLMPGPGAYSVKGDFDKAKDMQKSPVSKRPGYSLGIGHHAYEKVLGSGTLFSSGPDAYYNI